MNTYKPSNNFGFLKTATEVKRFGPKIIGTVTAAERERMTWEFAVAQPRCFREFTPFVVSAEVRS